MIQMNDPLITNLLYSIGLVIMISLSNDIDTDLTLS